ncbi:MAG: prenyltransferase [Chloroflexota bacterium]|nr:prenyltransferase [Chloroflexota bacterium]
MASLKTWLLETRPQFLLLTPVCVFAGLAISLYEGYAFNALHFVLAFFGALFAHIAVNVLNDYFDYKSGIDLETQRTPFSGGSGILPSGQLEPRKVLIFGLASVAVTIGIGIYFLTEYFWAILPIGVLGVIIILLYTPVLTRLPGITELVGPGLGFGVLMVLGTYVVQTGGYSIAAILSSIVAGLLIANLLLINEFPDVEADRAAGRKHLPIIIGRKKAAVVFCSILILAYAVVIGAVIANVVPLLGLLGLLTLPLGIKAMRSALKYPDDIGKLIPALGVNVIVVLITPLLMSIGIVIATYVM